MELQISERNNHFFALHCLCLLDDDLYVSSIKNHALYIYVHSRLQIP